MMKILTVTIIYLLSTCYLLGQISSAEVSTNLTVQSGVSFVTLKDQTFSPIVFSGFVPNIRLGFNQNIRNKELWSVHLSLSSGNIRYNNKYFSSTHQNAQFTLNYLTKLKSFGKSKVFLGGQLNSELNTLNFDGFSSGSWYTAQKLEPIVIYDYEISDRQSIRGQLHYPIASLIGRPPYGGVDEFVVANDDNIPKILYSRLKIYSITKLVNPDIELRYFYTLQKTALSITANYSYIQVNSVRKYSKNELNLSAAVKINIGKYNEGQNTVCSVLHVCTPELSNR